MANTNTDAGAEYDADEGGRVLDCGLVPIIVLPLPGKLKQIRVNQLDKMQMQKYLFTNTNAIALYYNLVPINVSLLPGKLPQIKLHLSYVISMINTQIQTGKYQKNKHKCSNWNFVVNCGPAPIVPLLLCKPQRRL